MAETTTELTCRFCGGISAVPGSTCPHCGREVMALCPQCKRYVDNQLAACDQCGTPLEAVGLVARGLSATEAQAVAEPDTRLPPPPRKLTGAQWQEILLQPAALGAIAVLTFFVFEAALLRGVRSDPSGMTTALALGAGLYPVAVVFLAWRVAGFRYRLLRDGLAMRGYLTRVEGRTAKHRLTQIVEFGFVDERGRTRLRMLAPFGNIKGLTAGEEVTVLYLRDEPAVSSVYPFLL